MMPIEVLCCCAVEDQALVEKLKKHLSSFQHQGTISLSTTTDIDAGKDRQQEIRNYFNKAQIILLLVSPAFMDSKECYEVQTQQALLREEQGKAFVIPIILRPVHWQNSSFENLQVLPANGVPVTSRSWSSRDQAFLNIVEGIRSIIAHILSEQSQETEITLNKPHHELVNSQVKIQAMLDDKAIKDHDELFGVDEHIQMMSKYLINSQGNWIMSLVGEGGIGKTALTYEVVSRYAAKAGFTKLAWVSAKTAYLSPSGDIQRKTSAEFHWAAIVKNIADQLNLSMGYGQMGWISDFHKKLHELPSHEKCLVVIDNLETVQDIKEAVQYICGNNTSFKSPQPHKILITSREAVQPYESSVAEVKLRPLKPLYAFQLIRSLGDEDIQEASNEDLQPIIDSTEGNPFLIKLCVRRFLFSHLPLPVVLAELKEANQEIGRAVMEFLYAESIALLEERCGTEAAEGILSAFCPPGPGNPVDYQFLRLHSHIVDEPTFKKTLEVACNLSLIRTSKLHRIYSIHSLLWNALCGVNT